MKVTLTRGDCSVTLEMDSLDDDKVTPELLSDAAYAQLKQLELERPENEGSASAREE